MKLFGSTNKLSFNTLKIRAALAEAGAAYELVSVDLARGENRTPEFLVMNPHAKIPVLLAGSFALAESDAILWYVAEKYPDAALLPRADGSAQALQGRARVMQWCAFASTSLYTAYLDWHTPALADGAIGKIERALAVMQAVLGPREHLAGAFSIADLSNAAILHSLKRRVSVEIDARHDRVRAWYDRITARPAWTQVAAG